MNGKEIFIRFREALDDVRKNGQTSIAVENLEKYLGDLERDVEESFEEIKLKHARDIEEWKEKATREREHWRMQETFRVETHKSQFEAQLEMFRSVIEAGREALKAVVLINGGAVVVVMGFLGAAIAKEFSRQIGLELAGPLIAFGAGVLLGAVGFGARYFSQFFYASEKNISKNIGIAFHVLSVIVVLAAYAFFAYGVLEVYGVMTRHFST